MKIGFDAKRITHNATGLGNYSRFVINSLATFYPKNEYLLYTPSKGKKKLRNRINPKKNISFIYPQTTIDKRFSALWRSRNIIFDLQRDKIDLFHGLSNELPFGLKQQQIPSIVTIHDLIFLRYPQYYHFIDKEIYRFKFKKACQNADKIIAVSEMTKRDIIHFFRIAEEKIEVVYQNCDEQFQQQVDAEEKQRIRDIYQLPSQFVLSVGSIEERKNLLLLVKAMKYVDEDIHLVAIGKNTRYAEKVKLFIHENNLSERITILHDVPFNHLPAFYQMASVFVYPSFFEGFGIPIIEALYSGTPVIAAKGSCLEEAGGPQSIYINPNDTSELADSIKMIMGDSLLRKSMITAGKNYVQRFSNKIIAEQLHTIYQRLI